MPGLSHPPGGMGEVYKAKDTRLDRTVAVKVLPPHTAENPEARQRFEREARAVSSLNHPHICALYDVGCQEGMDYLVMEHLEGESLSHRLAAGPLPAAEALRYAIHIAEALADAHRHGIFHRDLKPGNIMLTKSGAKLLDFGLAKLRKDPDSTLGPSLAPTRTKDFTESGAILGTVQYMAPEQLDGKEVDARTDLFAFGAVLYEMLAGRKAFVAETPAGIITAIMASQPPPVSTLQPVTRALDHVIERCLAKDPEARWQTARDLAGELQWIAQDGPQPASTTAAAGVPQFAARRRRSSIAIAAAAVAVLLGATALLVGWLRPKPFEPTLVRFQVPFPQNTTPGGTGQAQGQVPGSPQVAPSPDGRKLALRYRSPCLASIKQHYR